MSRRREKGGRAGKMTLEGLVTEELKHAQK
jgi:hypothetical protein